MESGGDLLSRAVSSQVPSALRGLTAVFGMGTGGTLSSLPPEMVAIHFADLAPPSGFALAFASVLSLLSALSLPLSSLCSRASCFRSPRSFAVCFAFAPLFRFAHPDNCTSNDSLPRFDLFLCALRSIDLRIFSST